MLIDSDLNKLKDIFATKEDLKDLLKNVNNIFTENKGHRIVAGQFEERLQYLESKYGRKDESADLKMRLNKLRAKFKLKKI